MRRAWLLGLCIVLLTAWPGAAQIRLFGGGASPASGGGVGIDGTPTANQLAYWTNATTIGGTSTLDVQITTLDLSAATSAIPWRSGATAPLTCGPGMAFFDTDTAPYLHICTATDTWTPLSGGGSGSFSAPVTITSTSATALAVGPTGTTNPTLQIDSSTASGITGLKITTKASGGGIELAALGGTNEGLSINTKGAGTLTLNTVGAATVRMMIAGTQKFGVTSTLTTSAQSTIFTPPAVQTLAAGGTITDDACGGLKRITAASDVTTSTANTFTAPAASNTGCILRLYNTGAFNITLDNNANFRGKANADMVLGPEDALTVGSDGIIWRPLTDIVAN